MTGVAPGRVQVGQRIRELRLARALSQEQLAERAGLHRHDVGGIERGERHVAIANIAKLAAGLDITLADLFAPCKRRFRRP